ncbi:multicopper oxidase family protein [Micromonospora sp. KC721]|uniref:multicopper oxidase family protein n=1 Tax=Micromonospora sp. KC721 TaxID=2530380 RepID=UPI00104FAF76|nr:multicopper oxidase family protein [Micromonospora sp. KC721]TDB81615.1 multicopper oxidase family protein [Micromonospora sp. KC721]
MISRRNLLAAGALSGAGLVIPAGEHLRAVASGGGQHGHGTHGGSPPRGAAPTGTPFSVRMPVPPVAMPVRSWGGVDHYRIPIRTASVELLPGVRTPVLSYGGGFVGPTIRARAGRRIRVEYHNQLDHPANVHLHGGHVAPEDDGHPMDVIAPGRSRVYDYPNRQRGATLWYHDHSHHTEAEHVYRGLHGFYLIDDPQERHLRLPDGQYDVPIMLRESRFDEQGNLYFDPFDFDRPVVLVNGRPQPYFPVAARRYRLRLLNASTHGTLTLHLDGLPMVQVGTDGGLLPAPVPVTELRLGPAERADVVVDFSRRRPGSQVVLSETRGPVLRFDVVRHAHDHSRLPDRLRPLPALPPPTVRREVVLSTNFETIESLINGKLWDPDRIDFRIRHGATEVWRITNIDTEFGGVNHTFHMHLVQFRVLDRNGRPPAPGERGLKDTVFLAPGESVRVQATFRGYLGRYVYHCHMLEHSAYGMMAQLRIVP